MNGWTTAAAVVFAGGLGACVWGVATGTLRRRVVAQNLATSAACPGLLLLAQGYGRPAYVDLALVLALLGPVGTLVFARLLADDLATDPPGGRTSARAAAGLGAAVVLVLCVAGAVLRVGARVFLGLGPPPPEGSSYETTGAGERPETRRRLGGPCTMSVR
ncbi:monovalent cation/H+ antiporter complex subunit F [Streptomyces cavernae]|uniref:monovalent cation/H+ antiporter complex subunit F n=1 Tax=Streptomyces cavernae TaxID=2259034 RepID=UPI000FEB929F|nr:MrpF/PhaF family protein [Streptomyces cavernae]